MWLDTCGVAGLGVIAHASKKNHSGREMWDVYMSSLTCWVVWLLWLSWGRSRGRECFALMKESAFMLICHDVLYCKWGGDSSGCKGMNVLCTCMFTIVGCMYGYMGVCSWCEPHLVYNSPVAPLHNSHNHWHFPWGGGSPENTGRILARIDPCGLRKLFLPIAFSQQNLTAIHHGLWTFKFLLQCEVTMWNDLWWGCVY